MRLPRRQPDAELRPAFEALVSKHHAQLFRAAYRLAGNLDDAEDLLQEALLEAYQDFRRFHLGTRFDRWVLRIMTHTYIDRQRKRRVDTSWSLDSPPEGIDTEYLVADGSGDPQRLIEAQRLEEPVQRALDSLSSEHRAVVVLSDIEGMSYEDIAATLHIPVGTVRSRLHRARERMRQMLAPLLRHPGLRVDGHATG